MSKRPTLHDILQRLACQTPRNHRPQRNTAPLTYNFVSGRITVRYYLPDYDAQPTVVKAFSLQ